MTPNSPTRIFSLAIKCVRAVFRTVEGAQRIWLRRVLAATAIMLAVLTTAGVVFATTIPYTVTVEHLGQRVAGVQLIITISDGVAGTKYHRYAKTNAEGSFSATAEFMCNEAGGVSFGIGAVKVLEDGNIEAGGGVGGSRGCEDSDPAPSLNLAISRRSVYDRHNAGDGCREMVGRPVNVTNGNMYLRQPDYILPGSGEVIKLNRSYNSMITQIGYFGVGWTSDLDERLTISCTGPFQCDTDYLVHYAPDGRINHFRLAQPNHYEALNAGNYARVERYADWTRDLIFKDGRIHRFDNQGNLVWKRDRNGNETSTTYTSNGLQFTITDPYGRTLTVIRDPSSGMVSQIRDSTAIVATYAYDTANRNMLRTVTYSDGFQYRFEYDTATVAGRILLTTVRDALGNIVETHAYDSQGRATTSEIHGGAERYEFDYGNLSASTDPHTLVRHRNNEADPFIETKYFFEKDRFRNMITKTEGACGCGGSGSETAEYFYDASANLVKTVDALGNETTFTYDSSGNRTTQTDIFGRQDFTYNTFGQLLTYQDRVDSQSADPGVYTAVFAYDSNGNLTGYTDRLGNTTSIRYPAVNNRGLPDSVIDARGNITKFTWSAGLLEEIEDPHANKTRLSYDARGRVKTVTNPLDHVTRYNYFDDGRRTVELVYPNQDTVTYKYDVRRLLESATDERGKLWSYEYDPQYRLTKMTDPFGHVREFGYDLMSNMGSYKDPLGDITRYTYDAFNRLKNIEYPPASPGDPQLQERFEYDKLGRITRHFDTANRMTVYVYDEAARTNAVVNAEMEVTTARYDQRFQTVEVRDPAGQVYGFTYDQLGRMLGQTRAGSSMSYEYNETGQIKRRSDYMGRQTTYSYDSLNRLTEIAYLTADGAPGERSTYAYDAISRLISATNGTGSVRFSYDGRNRITSTTDVFGHLLEYEYERTPAVNQRRLNLDGVLYAAYKFDDAERLMSLSSSDGATISFGHDDEDKIISRSFPNGVTTTYVYDSMDRLTRLKDATSSATLVDRTYGYNAASEIVNISEESNDRTFTYDLTDRLKAVTASNGENESYDYDDVGNRISSHLSLSYSYGPFNRLTATATAAYLFDGNGNTIQKNEGQNSWRYVWDHENRLTEVSNRKKKMTYKYDALGRRVHRYAAVGKDDTKFVYDGYDVLVDDELGSLTRYVNGQGIDNKLRIQSGTRVSYFLADHLGSTNALTDNSGSVTSQATYDSFGVQTGRLATRYAFTGREYDSFSGLYYNRARWYDPDLGRFISEDPIGLAGGINQYTYTGNDPMNAVDPFGMYEVDVHYYMTKYLALKFPCFGLEGAVSIAEADQGTDEDDETLPGYGRRANITYHALHPGAAPGYGSSHLQWRIKTARSAKYKALGRYLHYSQDTFSHDGYTNSGHGHSSGFHGVDKTATDVERTVRMAQSTFAAMGRFAKEECDCDEVRWDPSWEAVIRAFAQVETNYPNFADIEGDTGVVGRKQSLASSAALRRKINILGVRPR